MDLGRAFGYITEDESWLNKILIGGLILLIPIIGQLALVGFMLEVGRNVARGNPRPLPDWSNLGDKIVQGFYGFVIGLVYAIPAIILGVLIGCVAGGIGAAGGENDAAAGVAGLLLLCLYPLIFVVGLGIQLLVFAAYARYIQSNSLSAALQFSEVISIVRASPGTWVILLLVNILCGLVASLGTIACGIGVLFTTVYAQAAFGHALGQVTAQMSRSGGYDQMPPGYESPTI